MKGVVGHSGLIGKGLVFGLKDFGVNPGGAPVMLRPTSGYQQVTLILSSPYSVHSFILHLTEQGLTW